MYGLWFVSCDSRTLPAFLLQQARQKVVGVLTRENSLLQQRRSEFELRSAEAEERDRRVRESRERRRQELKQRYVAAQLDSWQRTWQSQWCDNYAGCGCVN